jgi:hypothetical protein
MIRNKQHHSDLFLFELRAIGTVPNIYCFGKFSLCQKNLSTVKLFFGGGVWRSQYTMHERHLNNEKIVKIIA